MKVINTLRAALAKIILKRRMSRENNPTGFPASEAGGDWKSSYADTTYYQPTLRTQTAVRSTKADRKPGLYYVRKKGSTRVWLEKVDKHGNHKQLSRPSAGKSKPRKNKQHHGSSRSGSDVRSQSTAEPHDRTTQYVMSQDPRAYAYDASSFYSHDDSVVTTNTHF